MIEVYEVVVVVVGVYVVIYIVGLVDVFGRVSFEIIYEVNV